MRKEASSIVSSEKKWVLPHFPQFRAPTYWERNYLHIDDFVAQVSDEDMELAIIYCGINRRRIPVFGEWVAFSIVGGAIAFLTGKFIFPPPNITKEWLRAIEHHIWEALWLSISQGDSGKLNLLLRNYFLRSFIPRFYFVSEECQYYQSNFVRRFRERRYSDPTVNMATSVREVLLRKGEKVLSELIPVDTACLIYEIARNIPQMLEISLDRLRVEQIR